MATNLFKDSWKELDPDEIKFILLERIGRPGQYVDRRKEPTTFYLPLAGISCQIKLGFNTIVDIKNSDYIEDGKLIDTIEKGPAFDEVNWNRACEEIDVEGPIRIGRACSFSSFRVIGSWRGPQSGVQILPPPENAPRAPCEIADHPFILEYPIKGSDFSRITEYRRMREHQRLTNLLNILLAGRTFIQEQRARHIWAMVPGDGEKGQEVKWVQEFYSADIGDVVANQLSPRGPDLIEEVESETYFSNVGHVGPNLQVPANLDELICCYKRFSQKNRSKFDRASFWMDLAGRQWTISQSASFASLFIGIDALRERPPGSASFRESRKKVLEFLEKDAKLSNPEHREKIYALRSAILHGSGLLGRDQSAYFGWSPPEQNEEDLMEKLWSGTRIAARNWLKNSTAT